jgi:hypothetical protein
LAIGAAIGMLDQQQALADPVLGHPDPG